MTDHVHENCNDSSCEDHYVPIVMKPTNIPTTVEFVTPEVSGEVKTAVSVALKGIRNRSFSGRNPELGKMIKCHVCGRRHRQVQALYTHGPEDGVKKATKFVGYVTCAQQFKELHVEEDLETGAKTVIYATAAQNTRKGIVGAAAFKGKRLKPHLNRKKLLFVERVRQLFGEGNFDPESEEYKAALNQARKTASRQLRKEERKLAKRHRRQQDVSRRINHGLAVSGAR